MRITKIVKPFALSNTNALGSGGGIIDSSGQDGTFPGSGQVPVATGSNGWAWGSNVQRIFSNTSNALLGPFVNFQNGSGIALSVASNTLTIAATGGGSGASLPWFDVKGTYGAAGDGTTDDTSAINTAIAAWNSAGKGVLYFRAGTYKATSALTTITAKGIILGDGSGSGAGAATIITQTSNTANLFTIGAHSVEMRHLRLVNTGGSESAGAGVATVTGAGNYLRFEDIWVEGFYDGMSLIYGAEWTLTDSFVSNPVRYGLRIANLDIPDGGDWAMANVWFGTRSRNATAAIRQESAGGGKMVNVKFNQNSLADQTTYGGVKRYTTGHHVYINGSANATSVMTVAGCSYENLTTDAVLIETNGTGSFGLITFTGCQFGLYSNNSGRCIKISAATNGTVATNGSIAGVVIDSMVARTDGTARAAIELVNTDRVTLGDIQLVGNFNARYTSSGDTNTTDGATTSGTTSPLTTKGDLWSYDTTNARFPVGADGRAVIADSLQVLGVRYSNAAAPGELLISDTPAGSPLVFGDVLQNEAQDDLLYGDL